MFHTVYFSLEISKLLKKCYIYKKKLLPHEVSTEKVSISGKYVIIPGI